jgi:hypothetical protein
MNIYRKGDFFASHVDSPVVPERMVGTLVVKLPISTYQGGGLKVTGRWETKTFMEGDGYSSGLQWAAIYGDSPHEVLPVKSGCRVTVTFLILLPDKTHESETLQKDVKAASHVPFSEQVEEDVTELANSLREFQCDAKIRRFGIMLDHKYTTQMVQPNMLKGTDVLLWRAAEKAFVTQENVSNGSHIYNARMSLLPVLIKFHGEYVDHEDHGQDEQHTSVFAMRRSDLLWALKNFLERAIRLSLCPILPHHSEHVASGGNCHFITFRSDWVGRTCLATS